MRKHPSFIALPEVILSYKKLANYGNLKISDKKSEKQMANMNSNSKPHISVSYLFLYSLYIFYTFFIQYIVHTVYLYTNCHFSTIFICIFLKKWIFFFTRCIFRYIRAANVFCLLFWFAPVFNFISSIVIVLMLIGICCRMMFWEKLNFSGLFNYCYWTLSDPSRAQYIPP